MLDLCKVQPRCKAEDVKSHSDIREERKGRTYSKPYNYRKTRWWLTTPVSPPASQSWLSLGVAEWRGQGQRHSEPSRTEAQHGEETSPDAGKIQYTLSPLLIRGKRLTRDATLIRCSNSGDISRAYRRTVIAARKGYSYR